MNAFDYTVDSAKSFDQAVEAVPAKTREKAILAIVDASK